MTMSKTEDTLKARFKAACSERDAILKKSEPLRSKRDAAMRKAQAAYDEATDQIKATESGLFDLQVEIATLSRALMGRTA
jgi:hypothetical protein